MSYRNLLGKTQIEIKSSCWHTEEWLPTHTVRSHTEPSGGHSDVHPLKTSLPTCVLPVKPAATGAVTEREQNGLSFFLLKSDLTGSRLFSQLREVESPLLQGLSGKTNPCGTRACSEPLARRPISLLQERPAETRAQTSPAATLTSPLHLHPKAHFSFQVSSGEGWLGTFSRRTCKRVSKPDFHPEE